MGRALLFLASVLTLAITAAHVFGGGPMVVPGLMASQDISKTAAWLLYFCWHDGTVVLALSAVALAYAALRPGHRTLAGFAAILIGGIGLLGLGVAMSSGDVLWSTPAPYAFNLIALVALAGIALDRREATAG